LAAQWRRFREQQKITACRAVALCNGYPVVKARRITLSMIAAAHRELETIREL